jgi:hypothetical protein
MPGFIKTPKDEARWKKAKDAASKETKEGSEGFWKLSNYIYHKMGKTEEEVQKAEEFKQSLLKISTSVPTASVPNPSKVGSTAVKMPKASKQPDPFGKPSLFFKNEDKEFDKVKHPSVQKLRDFLKKVHG